MHHTFSRFRPTACLFTILVPLAGAAAPFPPEAPLPPAAPASPASPASPAFTPVSFEELSKRQQERVQEFKAHPATVDVGLVRVAMDTIHSASTLDLDLPGGLVLTLDRNRIEERGPEDFTWYGLAPGTEDSAILTGLGQDLAGTIRAGAGLFRVFPLGRRIHAIVITDDAYFPPDCPGGNPFGPSLLDWGGPGQQAYQPCSYEPKTTLLCPQTPIDREATPTWLIVLYTPAAQARSGNAPLLIRQAVAETNEAYCNSQVNQLLRLAWVAQTSYTEQTIFLDLARFRTKGDGYMDEVHALRDSRLGDVAVLIGDYKNDWCGLASTILADENTAFAAVNYLCATGYYSFGHEIGHLQGARHNVEEDPTMTPFAYGHGYCYPPGGWRTIMSYNTNNCPNRLQVFSNPSVTYNGVACGNAATADNHRVLNETACWVARFRHPDPFQFLEGGCWQNEPYGTAPVGWYVGDFNGDARDDILRYVALSSGADVFQSNGTKFNAKGRWTTAGYGYARDGWYVGDFNGDGKDDLMRYVPGPPYQCTANVLLSNGQKFLTESCWQTADYGTASRGWYVGDFNGDGKDDIFRYQAGTCGAGVYLSNGSAFTYNGCWSTADYGNAPDGWYVGDFNGDGKDDLMRAVINSCGAQVFLSTGSAFAAAGCWRAWDAAGLGGAPLGWYVGDFNGDGRADLLRYRAFVTGGEVFLSRRLPNGADKFLAAGGWTPAGFGDARDGWYVGDFTGDGKDDLMRYIPSSGYRPCTADVLPAAPIP